ASQLQNGRTFGERRGPPSPGPGIQLGGRVRRARGGAVRPERYPAAEPRLLHGNGFPNNFTNAMKLAVYTDKEQAGRAAAAFGAQRIRDAIVASKEVNSIVATE